MRTVIVGSASAAHEILQSTSDSDVEVVASFAEAESLVDRDEVGAVVVLHDLSGLPGVFSLAERARARCPGALVVVDGPDGADQRVDALNWGIDACLMPPAEPAEIVATLRALERTRRMVEGPRLVVGPLAIDLQTRIVTVDGHTISLRPRDFDVLVLLARTPGAVVSRSTILDEVWEPGYDGLSNLVDVHIATIRAAIRAVDGPRLIETVRGVGYRLVDHAHVTA